MLQALVGHRQEKLSVDHRRVDEDVGAWSVRSYPQSSTVLGFCLCRGQIDLGQNVIAALSILVRTVKTVKPLSKKQVARGSGTTASRGRRTGKVRAKDLNVLFIGNSFTARNDLPALVERLASAAGST